MIPSRPDEYAHRRVNGRLEHAHRVEWIAKHGPIPEGMEIHHTCGVKGCVNVDHLRPVTPKEHAAIHQPGQNLLPYIRAKQARTHCVHGHEFTPANTHIARKSGTRICRACHAEQERARRRRLAEGTART